MIYHFLLLSDEVDHFVREIEIDSEASFFTFQNAILDAVNYTKDEITSFFICSDEWEKKQEITLMDMGKDASEDTFLMDETKLEDLIEDEGQRLIFIFDNLTERAFFIELINIIPGKSLADPVNVLSKGEPPLQSIDLDLFSSEVKKSIDTNMDTDFYGSDGFNEDELDDEGFSDMSIDDLENY